MGAGERANDARREAERQRFGQAVNIGMANALPRDRFGVPFSTGSNVLYRPELDMMFTVEAVAPVLDPRAPPGLVEVIIACRAKIHLPAHQPQGRFLVLGAVPQSPSVDKPADDGQTPPSGDAGSEHPSALTLTDPPADRPGE